MQKVIGVNLNGVAYQVEEDGYNALHAYLAHADTELATNPDKAEIVADLEQAIAEKCQKFLGPNKTVVSSSEIAQILAEMGPVDTGACADDATTTKTEEKKSDAATTDTRAAKRLYQIREGAMLSGLCNGLAAYLNMDVTLVRILFVILAILTKGVWILVYGVLSFVIPYAETSEERAAAHGQRPLTAKDLIDQAKINYTDFTTNKAWKRHWRHQRREIRRRIRRNIWQQRWAAGDSPDHVSYGAQIRGGLVAPVFGLINLALFLLLALAIISITSTHELFGYALPPGMPFWAWIIVVAVVYQVIASPFTFARRASLYPYAPSPQAVMFAPLIGFLWLAAIAWSVWWGYHHVPEVQQFIDRIPHVWDHVVRSNR